MAEVFNEWLKYVGIDLEILKWLKYLENGLDIWCMAKVFQVRHKCVAKD